MGCDGVEGGRRSEVWETQEENNQTIINVHNAVTRTLAAFETFWPPLSYTMH